MKRQCLMSKQIARADDCCRDNSIEFVAGRLCGGRHGHKRDKTKFKARHICSDIRLPRGIDFVDIISSLSSPSEYVKPPIKEELVDLLLNLTLSSSSVSVSSFIILFIIVGGRELLLSKVNRLFCD
ncbi:unnamed protein product [Schistosoma mattheei]|uniref:Uncharacterized protein n=1 Tax=Schistosoma mattheei TaxID=31246 RepID=A0A3P8FIS3_9TREM|nr:unnamed protein product [Schistosoma mattheei]